MRLQVGGVPHTLALPGCQVRMGEPVLLLHLWNERLPPIPPTGPTLAWAVLFGHLLVGTFQSIARQIALDPRLTHVRAVGGAMALLPMDERAGSVRLMQRLGFTVFPYHCRWGAFGEFWENFYSWWLMWAYNPASLSGRRLSRLHRSEVWMSIAEFMRRYHENRSTANGLGLDWIIPWMK